MMLSLAIVLSITSLALTKFLQHDRNSKIFREDQVIFTSNFNITRLLVPADGLSYIQRDFSDIPLIFFTVSDHNLEGGSCIYVLDGFAAYEILEGGRDSTSDYFQREVYFGAKDGVYKYKQDTMSAKKFGPFRDNIIQIQKANGTDVIYYLTTENVLFKLENNGTVKTRVASIPCALEFVLDNANNIYFLGCNDGLPHIVKPDGNFVMYSPSVTDDFKQVKLLRPAFTMNKCVPFFGDGHLFVLYANGSCEKKDFYIQEKPTAYSIDAGLYLVAALDGKIYEFNVMEALLKSMFGVKSYWPNDFTNVVMSIVETVRDGIHLKNMLPL